MSLSEETKVILRSLIAEWEDSARSERDPHEIEGFTTPARHLRLALDGTHDDIRKVIPMCPIFPKGGRSTLTELADAERDGRKIVFKEKNSSLHWEIE